MENNVQTSKIGVRDLVNVAIFTVIYFVIFYVCAMTGDGCFLSCADSDHCRHTLHPFLHEGKILRPRDNHGCASGPYLFPDGIWILRSDYRHCLWLAGRCHYEGWKI